MFDHGFPQDWSTLKKLIWLVGTGVAGGAVWRTITGAIVSFIAKKVTPIEELKVAIEPVQSGSGDPSPTNVRPITGWTGCNVSHMGKNLFDMTVYAGIPYNPTIGLTVNPVKLPQERQFVPNEDGTEYTWTTTATWQYNAIVIPCKRLIGVSAYVNVERQGGAWSYGYLDDNFKVLSCVNSTDSSKIIHGTLAPSNPSSAYWYIVFTNRSTKEVTIKVKYPYLIFGETAPSTYDPPQIATIPISWQTEAGTVYGGTLDVTTGVLTVDKSMIALGDLSWSTGTDTIGQYFKCASSPTNMVHPTENWKVANAICERYTLTHSSDVFDGSLAIGWTRSQSATVSIYVRDTTCETLNDFQAAIATTKLVYEIKTPVTYQLTPEQVSTLKGENNIWADTGDVTVTAAGIKEITPSSAQALNMLLGGMYTNNHTPDDVPDDEALDIILGGSNA